MAVVWWALVGVLALTDWYAVGTGRRGVERWAKPATMVALVAAALAMGAPGSGAGRWVLVALALGGVGDVLLLGESEGRFLGGLAAFLAGHLAYVAAFVVLGLGRPAWGLVGVGVLAVALVAGRRILPAAAGSGGAALAAPVAAYMAVIGIMVVTAWATGRVLGGVGAAVFVASDTTLAVDRFVEPRSWGPVVVMVTYHLGQALVVLGVLGVLGA